MKRAIAILMVVLASFSLSQDEFFVQRAYGLYHPETWPEHPSAPGAVTNWFPALPNWLVDSSTIVTNVDSITNFKSFRFSGRDENNREILRLRISQREDFLAARNGLLETLGEMESTIPMPRGTNGLEHLGDISYANGSFPAFVLFVRNNMFVSCYASIEETSLTNLLFSIDGQIMDNLHSAEE